MEEKVISKKVWLIVIIIIVIILSASLLIFLQPVPEVDSYDCIENHNGEKAVIEATFYYEAPDAFGNISHFVLEDGTEVALWDTDFSEYDNLETYDNQTVRVVGIVWISVSETIEPGSIISYPQMPCITDIEIWG